jgi:UDP-N-acetylmuramate--alanine ligase
MHFGQIKKIHFVGIGGIGMSGIAEILSNYELEISGCDAHVSSVTRRLERRGISVVAGHDPSHVEGKDLIVVSSAIRHESPEIAEARSRRIPVIRRAEMLSEIMRLKRGVAVAGTHGKTTTSAMTAIVLSEAGLDPTLIVGGVLRNLETNARAGVGEVLVVEADEYDRSFLTLHPEIAIITNIEADHLDCYDDLDDIRNAFAEFANRVPFFGAVIGCGDDERVAQLLDELPKRSVRYGLREGLELRALDLRFTPEGASFTVEHRGERLGSIELGVPGEHNVRNSLAAIAVGLELEIPFADIAAGLARFHGVERRFQILGECNGAIVVDDYAHHPTEIRATVEAARRSYEGRRIVALFQPHLYSRTRDFADDFAGALSLADVALVAPIYPAREEPIEGVDAGMITRSAEKQGKANVSLVDLPTGEIAGAIRPQLGPDDLFITMGAGDVHVVGEELAGAQSSAGGDR